MNVIPPECFAIAEKKYAALRVRLAALIVGSLLVLIATGSADAWAAESCGLDTRVPFAGHSLPLEGGFVVEDLTFENAFPIWNSSGLTQPTFLTSPPDGSNRLFFSERSGLILSIPNRQDVTTAELRTVLDISLRTDSSFTEEGLLGMAFHPDFAANGYFFVHYTATSSQCSLFNRCAQIVRYQIDPEDPDLALPASAFVVLEIERPGSNQFHNGGMIAFGADGFLYISVGDQGVSASARDITSLRGKLLRIDVDSGTEFNPSIPASNPFGNPVWFYGLRNPWRFSFDRENPGDLWISDVGTTEREEINWVPTGTGGGLNFGWPDCEGTLPLTPTGCEVSQKRPDLEYARVGGRIAVIGGYVYRGPLGSLNGHYVFADLSGSVFSWDRSTRDPQTGLGIFEERLTSVGSIATFGEDEAGELYTWDYFASPIVGRFVGSSPVPGVPFPTLLSETGFFSNVAALEPAPGMLEYDVTTPLWSDDAAKKRWIALPGTEKISFKANSPWDFPIGTALVKHFEITQPGFPARRLETRIMLRQTDQWIGLTYRWNTSGTDATLLLAGLREDIPLVGGGTQTWLYPSPSDCLRCHSAAGGRAFGVRTEQLNGDFAYEFIVDNQLHAWNCIGLFDSDIGEAAAFDRYAALEDTSASIAKRARSYLASNCSTCHQPGTGQTDMNLRTDVLIEDMNVVLQSPIRGNLGLPSATLIEPGDHTNSILSVRVESLNENNRMARGTLIPDLTATSLLADWINNVLFDSVSMTVTLDSDEDAIDDATDNCPAVPNMSQLDTDNDGLGDLCDPDQLPDLQLTAMLPSQATPGVALALDATVLNDGVLSAIASQVRFHLSEDQTLDTLDVPVGDCFVTPIDGNMSESCTDLEALVPAELADAPGDYYWIACADALGRVAEGDESNNCNASVVAVPEPGLLGMQIISMMTVVAVLALRRSAS